MNIELINRVKDRMRNGMSAESAIGLEWRLMRAREGFDGVTWAGKTKKKQSEGNRQYKIKAFKMLEEGCKRSEELTKGAKIKNPGSVLLTQLRTGRMKKTKSGKYQITQKGREWLAENDTQSALF